MCQISVLYLQHCKVKNLTYRYYLFYDNQLAKILITPFFFLVGVSSMKQFEDEVHKNENLGLDKTTVDKFLLNSYI